LLRFLLALLKRTTDPDSDARGEAFVALANRTESKAIPALIAKLNQGELTDYLREAAELFLGDDGDAAWGPHDFAEALGLDFPLQRNPNS
jgi:HEAT repeat protein